MWINRKEISQSCALKILERIRGSAIIKKGMTNNIATIQISGYTIHIKIGLSSSQLLRSSRFMIREF